MNSEQINNISDVNFSDKEKLNDNNFFSLKVEFNDNSPKKFNTFDNIPLAVPSYLQKDFPSDEELDFTYKELSKILESKKFEPIKKEKSQSVFSGYTNPITGSDRIFTREEIGKMSGKEYEENEEEINAQLRSVGIPSSWDIEQEVKKGGVIYVNSYTRSDGTQVNGYYRSKPRN